MPEMEDILEVIPEESPEPEQSVTTTLIITKAPEIIKVSTGIGDSSDFPAFDEDAENYCAKRDPKWGFRMTGGAEFHMPLTVFQVSEDSLAGKGGIQLGDIITQINGVDATNLTLAQAREIINSSDLELDLVVKSMEEEECPETQISPEEKVINLRVPVLQPQEPPREYKPTPLLDKRFWHPIMCENIPPKKSEAEESGEELPHHRIIRNIRRFFKETEDKPELRQKTLEDMLLILPGASKDL